MQWNRNLQCHGEQMHAPGGGSDARAAVDIQTQTPEAGASQMLPDPGVLDLQIFLNRASVQKEKV